MKLNLHRGSSFVSKLILWQTRGQFSHASITLRDGRVVESREFIGVRVLPSLDPRVGETITTYEVPTTDRQAEEIERFLLSQVGKKYDYVSLIRFLDRTPIAHWDKTKWFCSELAFEAFRTAGIVLLQNIKAWAVSPEILGLAPGMTFQRRIHG